MASTFASFAAPTGGGTNLSAPVGAPGPGRAVFVQSITMGFNTPISGRIQINSGGSAWSGTCTFPQLDIGFSCSPGYAAPLEINAFVRSGDRTGIGGYITNWLDPAVTATHKVGGGAVARKLADSINFEAKKVILMLSDSTWNGTGPSTVLTCVPWLINKFYRDQGQDTRYILKAYSGSNSNGQESYRAAGKYEFPQVDAIFYNLGINDAGPSRRRRGARTWAALIAWKQKRYPKAKLVVFGTTPVQDSTREAAIAAYRPADAAYIAGLSDPNVLNCSLGAGFDRTLYANYATSDANGTAVHPRD